MTFVVAGTLVRHYPCVCGVVLIGTMPQEVRICPTSLVFLLVGGLVVVWVILLGVVCSFPLRDLIGVDFPTRWMSCRVDTIHVFRGASSRRRICRPYTCDGGASAWAGSFICLQQRYHGAALCYLKKSIPTIQIIAKIVWLTVVNQQLELMSYLRESLNIDSSVFVTHQLAINLRRTPWKRDSRQNP